MDTGTFTGFELTLREPGIAWFRFNSPERLNGMTTGIKRDLIEAVTLEDIARVRKRLLDGAAPLVVTVGPQAPAVAQ